MSTPYFLCLCKFLQVLSKEGDWWKGNLNGNSGAFPCNYVESLSAEETLSLSSRGSAVPPSPSPSMSSLASDVSVTTHAKPLVARVTQPYEATKDTELSLKAGQYIKVHVTFCKMLHKNNIFTFLPATHCSPTEAKLEVLCMQNTLICFVLCCCCCCCLLFMSLFT